MGLKIALCQMHVVGDKETNLRKAEAMIAEAAFRGAEMIALPEMFNCPYSNRYFRTFAEPVGGETELRLAEAAKKNNIYLAGGSIPELDGEKVYNTSFFFDKNGNVIGKHRKMHLFDIDIKGGIRFKESDTLSAGNQVTVVQTEYGKIGLAICYDVRFPELFRLMAQEDVKMVILPAAFNMTTGPAHWELTMRARALDNQIYMAAVAPARSDDGVYQAYGHSCIANPWGALTASLDEKEGILYDQIDFPYLDQIRKQLPLLQHRRKDVYTVTRKE